MKLSSSNKSYSTLLEICNLIVSYWAYPWRLFYLFSWLQNINHVPNCDSILWFNTGNCHWYSIFRLRASVCLRSSPDEGLAPGLVCPGLSWWWWEHLVSGARPRRPAPTLDLTWGGGGGALPGEGDDRQPVTVRRGRGNWILRTINMQITHSRYCLTHSERPLIKKIPCRDSHNMHQLRKDGILSALDSGY